MKQTLLFLLGTLFSVGLFAQTAPVHVCGTSIEEQMDGLRRVVENRVQAFENGETSENDDLIFVPIRFIHIFNDDGTGGTDVNEIKQSVCVLNSIYDTMNVQFFIAGYEELFNTSINNNASSAEARRVLNEFIIGRYNAINIFVATTPIVSSGSGITLGFYLQPFPAFGGNDYIVLKNDQLTSPVVIAHEMGHFFSLAHTFFGWEGNPYDCCDPQAAPPDILLGNGVNIRVEKVARGIDTLDDCKNRNCLEAADRICDTEPDYLFAFNPCCVSGACNFTGTGLDPCGLPIDFSSERNMMSYFAGCGAYYFSADQQAAIRRDIQSRSRIYVRVNSKDVSEINANPVTEQPTLVSPINDEQVQFSNRVFLNWNSVPNASGYIVELSFSPLMIGTVGSQIVTGGATSTSIGNLTQENRKYYWRVTPFGEADYCSLPIFSEVESFISGTEITNTKNVSGNLEDIRLFPNPISKDRELSVYIDAAKASTARFEIINVRGQVVGSLPDMALFSGSNQYTVPTQGLSAGTYVLRITTDGGHALRRFVIQ